MRSVGAQEDSKPRGIVDLTVVQDVSDARDATGKPNSLKLSTATGQVCCRQRIDRDQSYLATEMGVSCRLQMDAKSLHMVATDD